MRKREFIVDLSWEPDQHGMEMAGFPELVRCKNCKHYDAQCQSCERIDGILAENFYCADGVRKDD